LDTPPQRVISVRPMVEAARVVTVVVADTAEVAATVEKETMADTTAAEWEVATAVVELPKATAVGTVAAAPLEVAMEAKATAAAAVMKAATVAMALVALAVAKKATVVEKKATVVTATAVRADTKRSLASAKPIMIC
jgi:hypothetical protein